MVHLTFQTTLNFVLFKNMEYSFLFPFSLLFSISFRFICIKFRESMKFSGENCGILCSPMML